MKANISLEDLQKTHGSEAVNVFQRIAEIGGFGDVSDVMGGLDVSGLDAKRKTEIEAVLKPAEAKKENR